MKPLMFDFAFKLKRAGFPQPPARKWQTWVTDRGEMIHIDKRFKRRIRFRSFGVDPQKGADGRLVVTKTASANALVVDKWYYLPELTELADTLPIFAAPQKGPIYERLAELWIRMKENPKAYGRWANVQYKKYFNESLAIAQQGKG